MCVSAGSGVIMTRKTTACRYMFNGRAPTSGGVTMTHKTTACWRRRQIEVSPATDRETIKVHDEYPLSPSTCLYPVQRIDLVPNYKKNTKSFPRIRSIIRRSDVGSFVPIANATRDITTISMNAFAFQKARRRSEM